MAKCQKSRNGSYNWLWRFDRWRFKKKIGSYLNIVKIAVPIILIGFGIIEFTKAIFAGDEDKMKKAQKNFLLRIGIAVIFFLTPTIVDFYLDLQIRYGTLLNPVHVGYLMLKSIGGK